MTTTDDLEILSKFLQSGGSLRMLKDISQTELDKLYCYGMQQMYAGDLVAARNIFYLLVHYDCWNSDYTLALGTTLQYEGSHQEAILILASALRTLVLDPRPSYLISISFHALELWKDEEKTLDVAMKLCHQQPQWQELKADIQQRITINRQKKRDTS